MGWLTRIKDSLLSKIRKKIPKKDLESVEKKREEKKILKEKKQIVKKEENEVKKENLVTKPEKKTFFGLFKKKQKVEKLPTVEKDPTEKKNWFQKLKTGLFKSSEKITEGVKKIFVNKKLDIETLNNLEELLIMADLGPATAEKLTAELANEKFDKNIKPDEVKAFLAKKIEESLEEVAIPLILDNSYKPVVVLIVGVNGTGKTTTIGKLAKQYSNEGKKIMIAACDTFRAAAVEQLQIWAERSNAEFIKGNEGCDAAGLAYEALEKAKEKKIDVLFIDTAGRVQNRTELMEELAKIIRVIRKLDSNSPHHCLLTLDATTGQNALSQVEIFKEMAEISGLIVTKLDGSAKGGILLSLAEKFHLPVHAIGVGEKIEDLQSFEAQEFANSLMGLEK
ncbi:MAG: Signal recognition particle receptor FtsY [Alphaproteobacteria bacterium MarineAlpha6_Bin6]|nr:signal recognition particle-docking protein FtsY [Pelagibacteraceae bacterium]PPR30672.1 MAG: Signal recognition particle receptor FtsY [Alphaproteobacteria bacterium MarineAlpha6_Bin6]PPR33917.1 MAG: Signal recognition particle receptor FtsY [Alphaproteobacteria bacterium MarineAlpha6_Bin5]|tara:strand:- start:20698 stop:21879 length:1182 start_codon:yes stop_codon:yes gene_type:complete